MPATFLTISALLGKADTTFRYVGGSSIVFNFLRSYIFGKVLRTMEYPDGDLNSIKIRRTSIESLKESIAQCQPPPFPTAYVQGKDVKQIVLWTSPHFTEKVTSDSDVYNLPDGCWIIWSKHTLSEQPIPRRGVKLEGPPKPSKRLTEEETLDEIFSVSHMLRRDGRIDRIAYDALVNLTAERDPALMALWRNFSHEPSEFGGHALRLLARRGLIPQAETRNLQSHTSEPAESVRRA
mmetsp:Transcript_38643/g.152591  ORF Transcript_38643/g.152591 Transcript_38643/m.152591 type:complete len:237 (+) Transcript_38643:2433-3143(+)